MTDLTTRDAVCARIASRFAESVGSRQYHMCFGESAHLEYHGEDRRLDVSVPHEFMAERIGRQQQALCEAAEHEVGQRVQLSVRVDATRCRTTPAEPAPAREAPPREQVIKSVRQRRPLPHYSLDEFVVGDSNRLAYSAASRMADEFTHPCKLLFLYGGCGLGKTHLLQGMTRRVIEQNRSARVHYATGESFTNEFITAVRNHNVDKFRRRVRELDLLIVDDVHFIADKQATQQEFLHSLDSVFQSGARIALASDCHPKLIEKFSEALISRCLSGLIVQVHEPDQATRLKLVHSFAQRRGLVLVDSVAQQLARRSVNSVRELEGRMNKLQALAEIDLSSARARQSPAGMTQPLKIGHSILNQLVCAERDATPTRVVNVGHIIEVVCDHLNVTPEQLLSRSRNKHVVLARTVAFYLARKHTSQSFPEIAVAFNRPSHSTVITGYQRGSLQAERNEPVTLPNSLETIGFQDLARQIEAALGVSV